jgi:hypothetical protein
LHITTGISVIGFLEDRHRHGSIRDVGIAQFGFRGVVAGSGTEGVEALL